MAAARRQLAQALDAAEAGVRVVIERRGVRFSLAREKSPSRVRASVPALLEILDPAVERGAWTWRLTPRGLRFAANPGPVSQPTRR